MMLLRRHRDLRPGASECVRRRHLVEQASIPFATTLVNSPRHPMFLQSPAIKSNDRRWCLRDQSCSRLPRLGAPVLKKIAACAVAIVLGLVIHARAAERVQEQWSALFPHHKTLPAKIGAPLSARFVASDTMRAAGI